MMQWVNSRGYQFSSQMWQVRQGVVPRLLSEILSTRIMVKQAMKKLTSDQKVLQRVRFHFYFLAHHYTLVFPSTMLMLKV